MISVCKGRPCGARPKSVLYRSQPVHCIAFGSVRSAAVLRALARMTFSHFITMVMCRLCRCRVSLELGFKSRFPPNLKRYRPYVPFGFLVAFAGAMLCMVPCEHV